MAQGVTLPLAFTATQATDYGKLEREARGLNANIKAEADKFKKYVDKTQVEIDKALATLRQQVAEGGVSENAQFFQQAAAGHAEEAKKWLDRTTRVMLVTALVAFAAVVAHFVYDPGSVERSVQFIVSKLIVLSVLTLIVVWCARNYRVHKHNETLNHHRAHALLTFRTFVEGSDDARVKDAILLQAAQAAFTARSTGYDGAEPEAQHTSPIVEVLGKVLPSGDSGKQG